MKNTVSALAIIAMMGLSACEDREANARTLLAEALASHQIARDESLPASERLKAARDVISDFERIEAEYGDTDIGLQLVANGGIGEVRRADLPELTSELEDAVEIEQCRDAPTSSCVAKMTLVLVEAEFGEQGLTEISRLMDGRGTEYFLAFTSDDARLQSVIVDMLRDRPNDIIPAVVTAVLTGKMTDLANMLVEARRARNVPEALELIAWTMSNEMSVLRVGPELEQAVVTAMREGEGPAVDLVRMGYDETYEMPADTDPLTHFTELLEASESDWWKAIRYPLMMPRILVADPSMMTEDYVSMFAGSETFPNMPFDQLLEVAGMVAEQGERNLGAVFLHLLAISPSDRRDEVFATFEGPMEGGNTDSKLGALYVLARDDDRAAFVRALDVIGQEGSFREELLMRYDLARGWFGGDMDFAIPANYENAVHQIMFSAFDGFDPPLPVDDPETRATLEHLMTRPGTHYSAMAGRARAAFLLGRFAEIEDHGDDFGFNMEVQEGIYQDLGRVSATLDSAGIDAMVNYIDEAFEKEIANTMLIGLKPVERVWDYMSQNPRDEIMMMSAFVVYLVFEEAEMEP